MQEIIDGNEDENEILNDEDAAELARLYKNINEFEEMLANIQAGIKKNHENLRNSETHFKGYELIK